MFKKILAKLGKGAATVDLKLDNNEYQLGESIRGEIVIQGGEVEQEINQLAVRFMMHVGLKQGPTKQQITVIPIGSKDVIRPEEVKILPFQYDIPTNIPLSSNTVSYYFDTNLDIASGVDRKDVDAIKVKATDKMDTIFRALNLLGFREKVTSGKLDAYGQEFAFFPTTSFTGQVSEIELRFATEANDIRVWLEVDIRTSYKEVEAKREFLLDAEALQSEEQVAQIMEQHIAELMDQPYMFSHPFSFEQKFHKDSHSSNLKSAIPGMIGGLAVGMIGGMLINEMLDDLELDDLVEDITDGFDDVTEDFEEAAGDIGDFFSGEDEF
ncbi:sporulation protein [Bacillus massiliigorillae]|uniref:sporulation protein n=1 Tax=Bacillus massiliigorillae TaxID=1243664 RepID=UPI0003A1C79A|nr:sporulation protein [Bacillus massiliigorillae]